MVRSERQGPSHLDPEKPIARVVDDLVYPDPNAPPEFFANGLQRLPYKDGLGRMVFIPALDATRAALRPEPKKRPRINEQVLLEVVPIATTSVFSTNGHSREVPYAVGPAGDDQ